MPKPHLFELPEYQSAALRRVAVAADVPMVEIMRRALDYTLRPAVLNEMFPLLSGQIRGMR